MRRGAVQCSAVSLGLRTQPAKSSRCPRLEAPHFSYRLAWRISGRRILIAKRAWDSASTWSSNLPFGNCPHSSRNGSSQGADRGSLTSPRSSMGVKMAMRSSFVPFGLWPRTSRNLRCSRSCLNAKPVCDVSIAIRFGAQTYRSCTAARCRSGKLWRCLYTWRISMCGPIRPKVMQTE